MQIFIGVCQLTTDFVALTSVITARMMTADDVDYPVDAPIDSGSVFGNGYNNSRVLVQNYARALGLYGFLFNDIDGLCRDAIFNRATLIHSWMIVRVNEALAAFVEANPTPAGDALYATEFGTWLAYWINWALVNAEDEAPPASVVIE